MRQRWFPLCIVLGAFVARVSLLSNVRHEFDWGAPLGIALHIAEAIRAGDWHALPLLSFGASIGLPNPALSSYVWALISFATLNAYVATFFSAALSVLAVAMTYDMTRRLLNPASAAVAATLMAISPWSIYFADGTWLQGQLEFCAVLVAWLFFVAINEARRGRLAGAFICAATLSQTYLVAFGLGAQTVIAGLASPKSLRKPLLAGALIFALAIGAFVVIEQVSPQGTGAAQPISLRINQAQASADGWAHTLRLVSGRDHEVNGLDRADPAQMRYWSVTSAHATLVEIVTLTGLLLLLLNKLPRPVKWAVRWGLCAWFLAPATLSYLLSAVRAHTLVHPFYLLLSAPAGYVLAGVPFAWLGQLRRLPRTSLTGAICAALALVPAGRLWQFAAFERSHPLIGELAWLPLAEQQRLNQTLRANCDIVASDEERLWTASLIESYQNAREQAAVWRANAQSTVIYLDSGQRTCLTQYPAQAPLPLAQQISTTLSNGALIQTQQWDPQTLVMHPSLLTNIGWRLLLVDAPPEARAGHTITVTQVWQIEALPDEDIRSWYFAPFAKLAARDGSTLVNVDHALSVLGADWRAGGIIISTIQIPIPAQANAGTYMLHLSLFDPNQKYNAVYWNPSTTQPVLVINRAVRVLPAGP